MQSFDLATRAFDATTFGGASGSPFGGSLAAGDFNGDGRDDLAISGGNSVFVLDGAPSVGLDAGNKKVTLPMSALGFSGYEGRVTH